jgi:hypothetical protein
MHATAPSPPDPDYRVCSACSARVHRRGIHKNRFGQYICMACRANGVRAVGRRRLHHLIQRVPIALLVFLTVMLVVLVVTIVVILLAQLHSYSNGDMVDDIKEMVRSINRMAR